MSDTSLAPPSSSSPATLSLCVSDVFPISSLIIHLLPQWLCFITLVSLVFYSYDGNVEKSPGSQQSLPCELRRVTWCGCRKKGIAVDSHCSLPLIDVVPISTASSRSPSSGQTLLCHLQCPLLNPQGDDLQTPH